MSPLVGLRLIMPTNSSVPLKVGDSPQLWVNVNGIRNGWVSIPIYIVKEDALKMIADKVQRTSTVKTTTAGVTPG